MTREQKMIQWFRSRNRQVDGLEKLINKFNLKITNVKWIKKNENT